MKQYIIGIALLLSLLPARAQQSPRIVNIVNFIRLLEPRDPAITEDVLYETVVAQVKLMRANKLPGTFLLQYDALMDPRYQQLLRSLPRDSFEIGAWWEIPQPLVERSGLPWRGRYPWDWRANIGFSTGYTPAEREKLIDTYMHSFKKIFGYYPQSVASWFIDAHSLQYMYDHYHIIASANCKDQYGTDGYTLWGGYWNQAYYPSQRNAYMPAQHATRQIPVPIFRMLGSDPIRQYDDGLEHERQGVITLEPVYPKAGGDSAWIAWFMRQLVKQPALAFGYTQAGQENSFTWNAMEKGLRLQFPLIARLRDQKKVRVETLAASGAWFRKTFPVTPATAVVALEDLPGGDKNTAWYNSRFYRANLLWQGGHLRFRDIHLFDEQLASIYENTPATENECSFYTLPVIDGYLWSSRDTLAGLRFKAVVNGDTVDISGGTPAVSEQPNTLVIRWPLKDHSGSFTITLQERQVSVTFSGKAPLHWFLDFSAAARKSLPFTGIEPRVLSAKFEDMAYAVITQSGTLQGNKTAFRMLPANNKIILTFKTDIH